MTWNVVIYATVTGLTATSRPSYSRCLRDGMLVLTYRPGFRYPGFQQANAPSQAHGRLGRPQ